MISFYDTQGDAVKISIWWLFLQTFRVPSLARKSLQPCEHRYRTISKYKLWYETPICDLPREKVHPRGFIQIIYDVI